MRHEIVVGSIDNPFHFGNRGRRAEVFYCQFSLGEYTFLLLSCFPTFKICCRKFVDRIKRSLEQGLNLPGNGIMLTFFLKKIIFKILQPQQIVFIIRPQQLASLSIKQNATNHQQQ